MQKDGMVRVEKGTFVLWVDTNAYKEVAPTIKPEADNIVFLPPGFRYTPIFRQGEPEPVRYEIFDFMGYNKANLPGNLKVLTSEEAEEEGWHCHDGVWRRDVEPDLTPENVPYPTSLDGVGRGLDRRPSPGHTLPY